MARHVSETGQGAFTWTGPYGSGKSSLVIALSALLSGDSGLQKQAKKVFEPKLSNAIAKALPPGRQGWKIVPVVGQRSEPALVIGDALQSAGLVRRKPRGGWTDDKVISATTEALDNSVEEFGGVILFIDEMGKFLEAAVHQDADIYIFQRLAEAASRSNGRLIVVGVLHQAFEEYAYRISHEIRNEWAKIQGRYVDLPVNVAADEQIALISRAIECDSRPTAFSSVALKVAELTRLDRPAEAEWLTHTFEACWPLHPVVASLLGPIARSSFGQNQRSVFGFLNSAEPHGFQDFLKYADESQLYGPDLLWDYLRANLESSILASSDTHRWALAREVLDRCEANGGDDLHVKLLKIIAVIDLFKERSGLIANIDLLRSCLPEISEPELNKALSDLEGWSFTIFRRFLGSHAIFAGSDFDIDQALTSALEEVDGIDFVALRNLASLQPILAKRHYHDTGALRWFDVNLSPLNELLEIAADTKPTNGTIGQFLLAIPTEGENESAAAQLCQEIVDNNSDYDIVVGLSKRSRTIVTLARELISLESVRNDHPELAGDAVARTEVEARLTALQGALEAELDKTFDAATWFRKNRNPQSYRHSDLNRLSSDMADLRFDQCPKLPNELLNRQRPSSSAIGAQNTLLKGMVLNEGQPRLGIEGFSAHGGLFASILEATQLYKQDQNEWRFMIPKKGDAFRLSPLWEAAASHLESHASRPVDVAELYDLWRLPPFGVKDGLMPILAVAFILSQRDHIAVYRDGIFRARFDDVDVEYLAKDPKAVQFRWMNLSGLSRRLLSEMAEIVRTLDETITLVHLEPIDVARGLVAIYEALPQWTKRTMNLSANAIRVRELFNRASDPNQFLFSDIPTEFASDTTLEIEENLKSIVQRVRDGLQELVQAYPSMLHRLRDLMLAELQVPNLSPHSLTELHERAENIRQISGDFYLEAFVGRLTQIDDTNTTFEGITSLVTNKPPRNWVDPDLDRATIDIADLSQKFLRAETFARVKGRTSKRQAMAVFIGKDNSPAPLLEEFDIADADRIAIDDLVKRLDEALEGSNEERRNVVLAALAELSARFMRTDNQLTRMRDEVGNEHD